MNVKLLIKKGSTKTQVLQLRSEETIIGRRQGCDLRIESSQVSRRHCLLRVEREFLTVEDLDSVNGTFLNGKRISSKQVVRPGDRLEIGPVTFVVDYKPPRAAAKPVAKTVEVTEEAEVLDVLPLADDELDTAQLEPIEAEVAEDDPSASILEALEVAEDIENDAGWHLPGADDLRDILSQMDVDEPKK